MKLLWKYKAWTDAGEEVSGFIIAPSGKAVEKILTDRELECFSKIIALIPSFKLILGVAKIPAKQSRLFFNHFARLHKSGVGIDKILYLMREIMNNKILLGLLEKARVTVSQGAPLSVALCQGNYFDKEVLPALEAGETGGKLTDVFEMLSGHFKKKVEYWSKIYKSIGYPVVVIVMQIVIMMVVSKKVIPVMQKAMAGKIMDNGYVQLSMILIKFYDYLPYILWFAVLSVWIGFKVIQKRKNWRDAVYNFVFRVPVIGTLIKDSALMLSYLNLTIMTKSGIAVNSALNNLYQSQPEFVTEKFKKCIEYINGGSSFAEALSKIPFFSEIDSNLVSVGEESGKIFESLNDLSDFYMDKFRQLLDRSIAILNGVLLFYCAAYILLLAASFIAPYYRFREYMM